jgi:4-amino-4-deoxy-L-arabinose transferase-like glycosyltransferase
MTKYHYALLTLVLIVSAISSFAVLNTGHDWGDDFASYIAQAKSIINGTETIFYEQNSFTIYNSSQVIGPVVYPWGFPLILAPFYYFFGLNPFFLKIPSILCFLLFLMVFFVLIRKSFSSWEAILLVAIMAFNPVILNFLNNILSDIPFLFFSTLSVFLIDRFVSGNQDDTFPSVKGAILGISIFLAVFIRTNGLVLLVTLLGCHIVHAIQHAHSPVGRKKRIVSYSIPYIVFTILWLLSLVVLPSGESTYISPFSSFSFIGVLKDNLPYYFHLIESFFAGLPSTQVVNGFLLAFLFVGILARLEKDYAIILYSVMAVAVLLVWPFRQGVRFIFPVIPFFLYFSFLGTRTVFSGIKGIYRKLGTASIYIFWIALFITFAIQSEQLVQSNLATGRYVSGPFDPASAAMFRYIQTQTPANSVIVFFKPRFMNLVTNRKSIMINVCGQMTRGDFIVINKADSGNQISGDEIGACNLKTTLTFENDGFEIYTLGK